MSTRRRAVVRTVAAVPAEGRLPVTELTRAECAALVGVEPSTWSSYVARGQAPGPVRHVVRTPLWDAAEVKAWKVARLGQGAGGGRKPKMP